MNIADIEPNLQQIKQNKQKYIQIHSNEIIRLTKAQEDYDMNGGGIGYPPFPAKIELHEKSIKELTETIAEIDEVLLSLKKSTDQVTPSPKIIVQTINGLFSAVITSNGTEVEVQNFDNDDLRLSMIKQECQQKIGEMIYPEDPDNNDAFLKIHLKQHQLADGNTVHTFDVYRYDW